MLTIAVGISSAFVEGASEVIENVVESINVSGEIYDTPDGIEYGDWIAPINPSTLSDPDDPTSNTVFSFSSLTGVGSTWIEEKPADWPGEWYNDILVYGGEVGTGQDFDEDEVTGDIYAVFDTDHTTGDSCVVYRSQDGGANWSLFGVGTNGDGSISNPRIRIARDAGGTSWVCMLGIWNEPSGLDRLYMRRWLTNGTSATWEEVNSDVVCADMDADIGSGAWLYVTYVPDNTGDDIWAARNALDGNAWVNATSLFVDPLIMPYPAIAAGAGGTVAVAFCDDRVTTNDEVRIKRSTNYGSTWLSSAQVSNNSAAADLLQTGIAFDHSSTQTGWITVTFDFASGDNLGYYYSTNSGSSWTYGNIFSPSGNDENHGDIRTLKTASSGAITVAYNANPGNSTMFSWTTSSNPNDFSTGDPINDQPATNLWSPSAGWITTGGNDSAVMYCDIGSYNLYIDYYGNTGVSDNTTGITVAVNGIQSCPNPFSDLTSIGFSLSQSSPVTLSVYNITGQLVTTLVPGETLGGGNHTIQWNGQDQTGSSVSPGVYFCHLRATGIEQTHMMVRTR
jgi:hypothetical protein